MTRFVLIGGYPYKAADGGKKLTETLAEGFPDPWRLLLCHFARPREQWQERFEKDKAAIAAHLPNRTIEFRLGSFEHFIEDVQWANTVYLSGGDFEHGLQEFLATSDWQQYVDGKTIAGSSAGADVLADSYFLLDHPERGATKGLGILPIKMLPHFRSDYNTPNIDWEKTYAELKAYDKDLPIYALGEGEFRVITKP